MEIFELIIDNVQESRDDLRAASLVHATWTARAQFYLCKIVTVRHRDPRFSAPELTAMLVNTGWGLKKNTKTLAMKGSFKLNEPGLLGALEDMAPALALLENVNKVSVSQLLMPTEMAARQESDGWGAKWVGQQGRKKIERLTVRNVRLRDFLELATVVSTMPSLARLCLWGVSWREAYDEAEEHDVWVRRVMDAMPAPAKLEKLTVFDMDGESLSLLCEWLTRSKTRIDILYWSVYMEETDKSTPTFISGIGAGVKKLVIIYHEQGMRWDNGMRLVLTNADFGRKTGSNAVCELGEAGNHEHGEHYLPNIRRLGGDVSQLPASRQNKAESRNPDGLPRGHLQTKRSNKDKLGRFSRRPVSPRTDALRER